jgi:threonine synthase
MGEVYRRWGYFLDPHSAVGWEGADKLFRENRLAAGPLGVLSTAHPAKFAETVEPLTGPVPVPPVLAQAMERKAEARTIPADVSVFIDTLTQTGETP